MLPYRWGGLSSIIGPERSRQPPYLTERVLRSEQSDLTPQTFLLFVPWSNFHPDWIVLWYFLVTFISLWKDRRVWSPIRTVFPCAFMLVLFKPPLICFEDVHCAVLATELNRLPWSHLLLTLSSTFPDPSPLLHRFATLSSSPLFFLPVSHSPPSFHISAGLPPCDIQSIGTGMDGTPCWLVLL